MVREIGRIVLALALATAGCRSRGDDAAAGGPAAKSSGPTMPTGMLMPSPSASPSAAAGSGEGAAAGTPNLRLARNVKAGAWTELQTARAGDRSDRLDFQHWRDDSRFVSLEAMTLMHEAFARALPGFDLFLPRLFSPEALVKLSGELDALAARSNGDIATTARELAAYARLSAMKQESIWVLGP